MNRRRILAAAGTGLGALAILKTGAAQTPGESAFKQIENALQAKGKFTHGVYAFRIERKDITNVMMHGVPIKPGFLLSGGLHFQQLSGNNWIMNADFPLKENEIDPFIDQLLSHNLVFQAEHQHFYAFAPEVFFIHFRQQGDPTQIARDVKAALGATSTPFPQTMPSNTSTPLPSKELGQILGSEPQIGSDGIVSFDVPRMERIHLGGVAVSPI